MGKTELWWGSGRQEVKIRVAVLFTNDFRDVPQDLEIFEVDWWRCLKTKTPGLHLAYYAEISSPIQKIPGALISVIPSGTSIIVA